MPAKLKSLSDINNPTEKNLWHAQKFCVAMLSSKASQGSLAKIHQVVYFSPRKCTG